MPNEYLTCSDCQTEFEFSDRDKQYYEDKGYNPPKRCRDCREKKKQRFADKDNNFKG